MATILEYHRSKDTIPEGEERRKVFVDEHRQKWLSAWPPEVSKKLADVLAGHETDIYGAIEFGVKEHVDVGVLHDQLLNQVPSLHLVEQATDESWFRVTVENDEDADRVRKVVEAH